jgi:hypothetical protein
MTSHAEANYLNFKKLTEVVEIPKFSYDNGFEVL